MIGDEWLVAGVNLITFTTALDYRVLQRVVSGMADDGVVIHSRPLSWLDDRPSVLFDVTGHAGAPASSLRRRLADVGDVPHIGNPADIKMLLSEIRRFSKAIRKKYWVWWTPSDLLAHGLDDLGVAKCLRILNSEFKTPFLALVAKDVHTPRGLNLMAMVSMVWIDVTKTDDRGSVWAAVKHPDPAFEGEVIP